MSTDREEDAGVGPLPTLQPRFVRPNRASPLNFHAAIKQLGRSYAMYTYLAQGTSSLDMEKLGIAAQIMAEDAQAVLDLYEGPPLGL